MSNYLNTYKALYLQGTGLNQTATEEVNLSGTIKDCLTSNVLQSNAIWDNTNSYAGAAMNENTLIGKYSVASFKGYQDYSACKVEKKSTTGTANIRMAALWCSNLQNLGSFNQVYRWTGLPSSLINVYNNTNYNTNYSFIDPFYQGIVQKYLSSATNNNIYGTTFLNNLDLNKLILVPYFNIMTVTLSGKNTDAKGNENYTTISTSNTIYTWSQIKPEDLLPEGSQYDEELWNKGYKVVSSDNNSITIKLVTGGSVTPYYGITDNVYSEGTYTKSGSYTQRYRWGVGATSSNYPSGSGNTNLSLLCPIVEYYNDDFDGVVYTSLPGWNFGKGTTGQAFNYQYPQMTFNNVFAKLTSSPTELNPLINTYSTTVSGISNSTSLDDENPQIINTSIYSDIEANLPIGSNSNNVYGYMYSNGCINYYRGGYYQYRPILYSSYSLKMLWGTLASLGCFVGTSAETGASADLENRNNNPYLYLGHMGNNGITDGVMLQGSEIVNPPQLETSDLINNRIYSPVVPGPGGGDEGDIDDQLPSNRGFQGNFTIGYGDLALAGSFIQYITTGYAGMSSIKTQISSSTNATFWDYLGTTSTQNDGTSLIETITSGEPAFLGDYILSIKQYPFSVSSTMLGTGTGNTRLKFGYKGAAIDNVPHMTVPVPICKLDFGSIYIPFLTQNEMFWDYEPYTRASIYLPLIGEFPISSTMVIGKTIETTYVVDLTTGAASAIVTATDSNNNTVEVLSEQGMIGAEVGIAGNDIYSQAAAMISSYNKTFASVAGGVGNLINSGASAAVNAMGDSLPVSSATGLASAFIGLGTGIRQGIINDTLASRDVPRVITSGSGYGSHVGVNIPYLKIERPIIEKPDNFGSTVGYLWNGSSSIGSLTGYTVCSNVDISGISNATQEEKALIKRILESGFYV